MIQVRGLTKQYGDVLAVKDLNFDVEPGKVTGFLGPNGAGKSTTMRMMLGLDKPTSGSALVNGRSFEEFDEPLREVGALLDPAAIQAARTGRNHLRIAARSNGIPAQRVDEVISQVGLASAARRRIKTYSLGMRQRLGIAAALLGDPQVVMFDEPINGLDLDGVLWIRSLLRQLADEGRTVLVSSHLMSEMQQTADRLIVIGRGQLIKDTTTAELINGLGHREVKVRSSQAELLLATLRSHGLSATHIRSDELEVRDASAVAVGDIAHAAGIALCHLSEIEKSLEEVYLELTGDSVDYRGSQAASTQTMTAGRS